MLQYTLYSPQFHLTMLALVGMMAFQGLVAIWAATTRVHWFWRALGVWSAVMLLVPIRAYEPAVVFAMASPIIAGLVIGIRRSKPTHPERNDAPAPRTIWRFGLRDLFLLLFIVGLTLAGLLSIGRRMQEPDWPFALFIAAVTLALTNSMAYGVAAGPRRWRWGLTLLSLIPISALVLRALGNIQLGWGQCDIAYKSNVILEDAIILCLFLTELIAVVAGFTWLATEVSRTGQPKRRAVATFAFITLVLAAIVPLSWLYWRMLWLTPFPPSIAGPNNYARISEIAQQVSAGKSATDELAHLHEEVLGLLQGSNYVPFDPAKDLHDGYTGMVIPWRDLARSLKAEGDSAALAGEYDRATAFALGNVRLGTALRRGGLRLQSLVGDGVVDIGVVQLVTWRDNLSAEQIRQSLQVLERSDLEDEPRDFVNARDRAFDERVYAWEMHWDYVVSDLLRRDSLEREYNAIRDRSQASRWLLQTDLAVRLYAFDNGEFPQSLDDLAPDYVPRSLLDPYSHKPFVYHVSGQSFELYSVGKDGENNGGRFANWMTYFGGKDYDLDLDTMIRQ